MRICAEAVSTDCEKCGCVGRKGVERKGCEGAITGSCRDARASGLGRGPPFAVVRSLSTERCVDVVFLDYREGLPHACIVLERLGAIDGRGPAMGRGGHPLTYSFPRDIFHVGKIIER